MQRKKKSPKVRKTAAKTTKKVSNSETVKNMEEFRLKYLPMDVSKDTGRHLSPKETGEQIAKQILVTAREALTR